MKNIKRIFMYMVAILSLMGCAGGYSFTGASISPDVKTISIQSFPNNASTVQPQLSMLLTNGLKNRFMSQTSLKIVNFDGDLSIKGEIIDYSVTPIGIQSDGASMNRLSITIHVKFVNKKDSKANFDQNFSRYSDYFSTQNLADVEDNLMNTINEALIDDVFNKAVVNW